MIWYSIVQKFHKEGKKNSRFTILSLFWPTAMIRPKSQNYKIGHDGILSIENSILVIKNHILLFQLVTDQQPKNVLPISVATWNFLFISVYMVIVKYGFGQLNFFGQMAFRSNDCLAKKNSVK
jgi:hypothetical protein